MCLCSVVYVFSDVLYIHFHCHCGHRVPVVLGQTRQRCSTEESTTLAFFPVRSALPQLKAYLKGQFMDRIYIFECLSVLLLTS